MQRVMLFVVRYITGLLSCLYLFTAGLLFKRHRHLLYDIYCHFISPVTLVPEIAIDEILSQPLTPVLYEPAVKNGNVLVQELVVIASLAQQLKPDSCFEIGTFDGRTTLNLAANTGPQTRVYTLDLPREAIRSAALHIDETDVQFIKKDSVGARLSGTEFAAKTTQLLGDSASFDYGPYEGKQDLVFVDGSHSYEYVLSDSRVALRLLKPQGGTILWHDYGGWPGVTKGLNELLSLGEPFAGIRHIAGTSLCILRNKRSC